MTIRNPNHRSPRSVRLISTMVVLAMGAMTLGGTALGVMAPAAAAASITPTTSPAAALLARFESAARAHGVDPSAMLNAQLHLTMPKAGGGTQPVTLTVAQAIADSTAQATPGAPTLPGLPVINAGDVIHAYFNYGSGSALGYHVTDIAPIVPSTPPVITPPAGPLPPAAVYDVGGPLVSVVGSYISGYHSVGTTFGSNVDTSPGAPTPFPVWLPLLTGGFVSDTAINLTGHAVVTQSQFCLFGFCAAVGALIGDGATVFDQTLPAVPPTPGTPSVPGTPTVSRTV